MTAREDRLTVAVARIVEIDSIQPLLQPCNDLVESAKTVRVLRAAFVGEGDDRIVDDHSNLLARGAALGALEDLDLDLRAEGDDSRSDERACAELGRRGEGGVVKRLEAHGGEGVEDRDLVSSVGLSVSEVRSASRWFLVEARLT